MKITPETEAALQEAMCFPKGECDWECIKAEDKVSKTSGNEMIQLNLKVYLDDGSFRFLNDYLVGSDHPICKAKIRHFFASAGQLALYETGNFSAQDCEGLAGKLSVKITPAKGSFPAKNEVDDYLTPKDGAEVKERVKTQRDAVAETWDDPDDDSDSIPF